MIISDGIKADLRAGHVAEVEGERIGLRRVKRAWFNLCSGHYVVDATGCFMWSENGGPDWHVVPRNPRRRTLNHKEPSR